jgi:serine/threonine-protein kinase
VERFLRRAWDQRRRGDVSQARETLTSLRTLVADQPNGEAVTGLIDELLTTLEAESPDSKTEEPLRTATVRRAAELQAQRKTLEARELWNSLISLYEDDPAAEKEIEQAKEALRTLDERPAVSPESGGP